MAVIKIESPCDFGRALGPLRVPGAGGVTDRFRQFIGPAGLDDPADIVLDDRQRRLGIGFGNQNHRTADRQQIVEPAGHRYAGDVLAVGNDPDVRGRKKRLQLVVLDAIDQRDVRKLCLGLHLPQLIEPDPPARQQEVNIPVVAQQPRRLEDDDGIVGKAEIAGQTDDEAGGKRTAIRIIGIDRANAARQRRPVRNEADLVACHSAIAQQQFFGVAADDDDGVERAKHQRVQAAHRLRRQRLRLQQARHDEDVGIEIVHDQHRPRALQFRGGGKRIGQHEGCGHGERDVAAAQFHQQRCEHPDREQQFGQSALEQRGLAGHPVPDLDDFRLAGGRCGGGACRSRQHQNLGFPRHTFRNRRHDRRRRARIRRIMLADDDDFSGLLHHGFRGGPHGRRTPKKIRRRSIRIRARHP